MVAITNLAATSNPTFQIGYKNSPAGPILVNNAGSLSILNSNNTPGTLIIGSLTTSGTITAATITGLNNPLNPTDAANKTYVDNAVQGLNAKDSVQNATVTALPTNTYNNGASGVGATLTATADGALVIDGNTSNTNDRVLIKNEATSANNGIYVVTQTGSVSTPYILTRSDDFDIPADIPTAFVFVEDGTVNAATGWVCTTPPVPNPIIGTTAITFTQFSGAGTYTAGAGLTLTGSQFSANTSGVTTSIISNNIVVLSSSTAGQVLLSQGTGLEAAWGTLNLASSNAVGTSILGVVNGGTGVATLTVNGVVYGSGASAVGVTAAGTGNNVLTLSGGVPIFSTVVLNSSTAVSGTLGAINGGTGQSSITTGDILYGSATNTWSRLPVGSASQILTSTGSIPIWQNSSALAIAAYSTVSDGTNSETATNNGTITFNAGTATTAIVGGTPNAATVTYNFTPTSLPNTGTSSADSLVLAQDSIAGAAIKRTVSSFISDQSLVQAPGGNLIVSGQVQPFSGSSSPVTNGWTYLTNGFMLQWGIGTASTNGGTINTFPRAFPTICLMVTACVQGIYGAPNTNFDYEVATASFTATTFNSSLNAANSGSASINWMAIGH
jgi:hypothetical protein